VHVSRETVAGAVPPAVLADLRRAFAREIASRLPHLADLSDLETARRDAHTIASSAWVVGEPDIARLARQVESALPDGPVAELLVLLRGYVA
jgi:HPt (histidine-containing phosphotransfer) domain-containing protein